jgi:hypothetical protein
MFNISYHWIITQKFLSVSLLMSVIPNLQRTLYLLPRGCDISVVFPLFSRLRGGKGKCFFFIVKFYFKNLCRFRFYY